MIVVVGGQSRNCGKTTAICQIIEATRDANWIAIKITPHAHEPGGANTDTSRYREAGAKQSILRTDSLIPSHDREGVDNLIIESNSILDHLTPDLYIYCENPLSTEIKPSALRHKSKANHVMTGPIPTEILNQIRHKLTEQKQ